MNAASSSVPPTPAPGSRRWPARALLARGGLAAFTLLLLYPFIGFFLPAGAWQWNGLVPHSTAAAVEVSLGLTGLAMLLVAAAGTPVAAYLARCRRRERLLWEAPILIAALLPPLALGILFSLAFGPNARLGHWLLRWGLPLSNSAPAFVLTQFYVSIGYYVIAARAALAAVPRELEITAALLGQSPARVFRRVTFPLARLGLAAALSLAWVRALGELGAVLVTAYYPAGMPVQIWINLQDAGMSAVLPLLVIFLLTALPLPWLLQLLAERRHEDSAPA